MTKLEFIRELQNRLSWLPKNELEERLNFYSEMIDDRIEEGLLEDVAVSEIGTVEEIAEQIILDTPLSKIAKEKIEAKKDFKWWEILVIAVGAPIWLSILISVFALLISIYALLWAVIISLWAVFGSLIGCSLGGMIAGVAFAYNGKVLSGVAVIGAGIVCAGLSIFMFYGCKVATKGLLLLTKKTVFGVKNSFMERR